MLGSMCHGRQIIFEQIHKLSPLGQVISNVAKESIPEGRSKHCALDSHIRKQNNIRHSSLDSDQALPIQKIGIQEIKKWFRQSYLGQFRNKLAPIDFIENIRNIRQIQIYFLTLADEENPSDNI